MNTFIGMIPEEVDDFATNLETKAGELQDIVTLLTGKLNTTTWVGTDFNRFEETWQGTIAVNLQNAASQLTEAAASARSDAESQRLASS